MLRHTELEIGSYFEFEGNVFQVHAFDHKRAVFVEYGDPKQGTFEFQYFTFDSINGIEITPEILHFFGFDEDNRLNGVWFDFETLEAKCNDFATGYIQYIHELQRFYRVMTKKSLKFRPYIINNGKKLFVNSTPMGF
jgi:hypothetical protein